MAVNYFTPPAHAEAVVHLAHAVGEVADPGLEPGDAGEGYLACPHRALRAEFSHCVREVYAQRAATVVSASRNQDVGELSAIAMRPRCLQKVNPVFTGIKLRVLRYPDPVDGVAGVEPQAAINRFLAERDCDPHECRLPGSGFGDHDVSPNMRIRFSRAAW